MKLSQQLHAHGKNMCWIIYPLFDTAMIIYSNPSLGFSLVWEELKLILNQQMYLRYVKCVTSYTSYLCISYPIFIRTCLGFSHILATCLVWISLSSSNYRRLFSNIKRTYFVFTFVRCNLFVKYMEDRWTLNCICTKTPWIWSAWLKNYT